MQKVYYAQMYSLTVLCNVVNELHKIKRFQTKSPSALCLKRIINSFIRVTWHYVFEYIVLLS